MFLGSWFCCGSWNKLPTSFLIVFPPSTPQTPRLLPKIHFYLLFILLHFHVFLLPSHLLLRRPLTVPLSFLSITSNRLLSFFFQVYELNLFYCSSVRPCSFLLLLLCLHYSFLLCISPSFSMSLPCSTCASATSPLYFHPEFIPCSSFPVCLCSPPLSVLPCRPISGMQLFKPHFHSFPWSFFLNTREKREQWDKR